MASRCRITARTETPPAPRWRRSARTRARLPEAQRVVVHLHRFEGLRFADVGAALGISEEAAKVRAFRAYAALRTQLADLAEDRS